MHIGRDRPGGSRTSLYRDLPQGVKDIRTVLLSNLEVQAKYTSHAKAAYVPTAHREDMDDVETDIEFGDNDASEADDEHYMEDFL